MTNATTSTNRGWGRSANVNGYAQSAPYGQYQSNGHLFPKQLPDGFNEHFDPSLNQLSTSMANMMLHGIDYTGATKPNTMNMAGGMTNMNGMLPSQSNPGLVYYLPNGTVVCSDANSVHQTAYPQYTAGYGLNATNNGQLQHASYQNHFANAPVTPRGNGWTVAPQIPQEVPDLAAPRRSSFSSNEADSPQTPLFTSYLGGYQPQLHGLDQQASVMGNFSPSHLGMQVAKTSTGENTLVDFEAWTSKSPAIPPAVPAIDSPGGGRGTLEQIMHNPNGTTNVYVRGLHPDTSDEMLHAYGSRFGNVQSAKSIIDTATGQCKGFGFIKYHNFNDAENAIRGFYYRNYEAKYARVGHNERLKTLANPNNTNLYLSNLPKNMNEADLQAIFKTKHPEIVIVNHKVLKDENGLSRGVGFARFETHEICETIIAEFSGMLLDEAKDLRLQIRYADTDDQKEFKAKTAKSRQFKSTEYNRSIQWMYGYQSPTAASFGSPLQVNMPAANGMWMSPSPISPTYPWQSRYAQSSSNVGGPNTLINPVPLHARASARVKIESPSVVATTKQSSNTLVNSPTNSEEEPGPVSKLDFAVPLDGEDQASPTKAR
ncbi:MAG: hypothetical protein L6R42_001987 [Xanthoria sp. 1 TBL-2021]|nr:MAG: hypothetical protein L6R42_001987 [Xanthoria sp. 1 TBL-2021]